MRARSLPAPTRQTFTQWRDSVHAEMRSRGAEPEARDEPFLAAYYAAEWLPGEVAASFVAARNLVP